MKEQTQHKREGVVVLDTGNDCERDAHDCKERDCNEPEVVVL